MDTIELINSYPYKSLKQGRGTEHLFFHVACGLRSDHQVLGMRSSFAMRFKGWSIIERVVVDNMYRLIIGSLHYVLCASGGCWGYVGVSDSVGMSSCCLCNPLYIIETFSLCRTEVMCCCSPVTQVNNYA